MGGAFYVSVFGAFYVSVNNELATYSAYSQKRYALSYWRLSSGIEVDFILDDLEVAIEVKATERIRPEHTKGLLELKKEHPELKKSILVTLESRPRMLGDILLLPVQDFLRALWAGEIL